MKRKSILFICIFCCLFSGPLYSQLWKQYIDSAKIFGGKQNTKQAVNYLSKAKVLIPADSVYTVTYIRLCKELALQYYINGETGQAVSVLNDLNKSAEKLYTETNADHAWACNMLGAIYNNSGNFDSAKICHLKALEIREKLFGKKSPSYAQSCNNLGALYLDLAQYDQAEPLLLQAKEIREKLAPEKQQDPYAITCVALGNLYKYMGQYEKAALYFVEAKERRGMAGKENRDYALSCNILADLYSYMQLFEKAESLYLEAKDIRQKLNKDGYEYGQSCNNLSSLYKNMGQYEKAEPLGLEARRIYELVLPPGHGSRTINLNNLGELYYSMGKYKEAESFFVQARALWENSLGKGHPYFISNTEELARLYWNMNENTKADSLFKEAYDARYVLLDKVFQFTNENEKQSYLKNINGTSDEYMSFYYAKKDHSQASGEYEMSLLSRNLILSSGRQMRQLVYNSNDTMLANTYIEWTSIKEKLSRLYSNTAKVTPNQVNSLEAIADSIEKKLSRGSAAFKKSRDKINWQDIRSKLNDNEAAIEFVEFNVNNGRKWTDSVLYVALVLKKNQQEPVLVPLFEKKQLESILENTANKSVNDGISQLYASRGIITKENNKKAIGKPVYSLVWKPLEKTLKDIKTVYFAPAGILHRIAFAALPLNNNEVLSDRYQLVQLATTASVADQQPVFINAADDMVLYGGIDYDADSTTLKQFAHSYAANDLQIRSRSIPDKLTRSGSFNYLAGTAAEIKNIGALAKKTQNHISILSGNNAAEESFKLLNGKASPAVIHIATHGFFFADPKSEQKKNNQGNLDMMGGQFSQSDNPLFRSGLLFAGANNSWQGKYVEGIEDGILTAYEVSNMFLPNTRLAVLSACETALGDIHGSEGVYGLQRAFKMAGVQNLVMSLWKVPDAETAAFMQLFYENMFAKQSISDAFYHAQTTMKNKYRNDPYKWAAWVLVR